MSAPHARPGASPEQLCELLGITRPVVLAPMAKVAGGALAAAVSDAGGLGIVGGGYGDPGFLTEQMGLTGSAKVGIGVIVWNMSDGGLEEIISHQPAAVWLAFGDLVGHVKTVRAAGITAICQVATVDEAEDVVRAGADVLVVQGTESGGHGRPQLPLAEAVAAISQRFPDVPLVAAGGINRQGDLDALRSVGAAGAALGTAFYATNEALDVPEAKDQLVRSTQTVRSVVYDYVRGPMWPAGYDGRTAVTELTARYAGVESTELAPVVDDQRERHAEAVRTRDMSQRVLWAGSGVEAIDEIVPARTVVERFARVL